MANHNDVGKLGEEIAEIFLKKKGFNIFTKNFRKNYGEIDIIATKNKIWRFVEVKTFSCSNIDEVGDESDSFRPEENVTPFKIKKLMRVIGAFILKEKIDDEWQFDVCAVWVDYISKKAKVRFIENVVVN